MGSSLATWDQSGHSYHNWRCQVSERGIEKGARGISKGKKRARGLRHVYCNLYMCIIGMNVVANLNSV
jgi:hypothetical protein